MDVIFKRTVSASLDDLPIVDGQLIVLRDSDAMYYDMDGKRHPVMSALDGSFVTLDTEQIIPSNKQFTGTVTIVTLKQSTDCIASEGSVALGKETTALGQASVSSGHQTSASGDYSTASGNATTASGKGSHAEGAMTVAERNYSTVVGTGNDPQSEDIFEIGNGHVTNDEGQILPEDQQTFSNAFRVTEDGTAIAQKDFQLDDGTKLSDRESSSNKVTSIGNSPTDIQYPSARAVKAYVDALPHPMTFKGSLGTGGTITVLPSASADNEGYTYKVVTSGMYSGQQADQGDTFISDGESWVLIPSGDEPSGTVTNVAAKGSNGIEVTGGPISTAGTLNISGKDVTDSSSGMMTPNMKKKLDNVEENANNYILPTASTSVKGGVKAGKNLTMEGEVLNATDTTYEDVSDTKSGLMTPTMKRKLDTITESASAVASSTKNGYISVDGKDVKVYEHPGSGTNPHGTTKTDVGLGSVDNTADADKSVKHATTAGSADSASKASAVADYNETSSNIKIGYKGKGISGDEITHIAGYTTGEGDSSVRIKDVSKDALKSWLGLGSLAYSSATIPTSLPADGGNSSTVNGHTVESNVPADAKFTDTVYDDTTLSTRVAQTEKDVKYAGDSYISGMLYDESSGGQVLVEATPVEQHPATKVNDVIAGHENTLNNIADMFTYVRTRLDSLIPIEEANL